MDLVSIVAAAEEAAHSEQSETPFFVAGILLAIFGVVSGVIGITRPNLSEQATRGLAALGIVLVVAAMTAMIVIS